jgi:hypothetical protein
MIRIHDAAELVGLRRAMWGELREAGRRSSSVDGWIWERQR